MVRTSPAAAIRATSRLAWRAPIDTGGGAGGGGERPGSFSGAPRGRGDEPCGAFGVAAASAAAGGGGLSATGGGSADGLGADTG